LYRCCIKNLFDRILALTGLILSAPVFFLVWLALFIANRGEPFFFQSRPGRGGKIFRIVKFRTMNNRRDSNGELLPDSERLTPVGRFVRKTSLDEIPQLINVLKGDMSLIGPRPLLVEYLPLYNAEQARRHEVRPGITGWAQVNGRNAIDWETKFRLDVWYVDHLTFLLDLKILWLTVLKVFRSEGISASNSATMEKFTGSDSGN
jgi:lipopolysaccharide/colanic/teichoic acid biosynthesis glycosyltransferase